MAHESDTNKFFDSSDEEYEVIENKEQYIDKLAEIIKKTYDGYSLTNRTLQKYTLMSVSFGLALHNYADRVFNRGDLRETYLRQKDESLSITPDERQQLVKDIKSILISSIGSSSPLDMTQEEIESINDKTIETLFHSAFNTRISLPSGIRLKVNTSLAQLLPLFQDALVRSKLSLKVLRQGQSISKEIAGHSVDLPVMAEISRRVARNLAKYTTLLSSTASQTTLVQNSDLLGVTLTLTPNANGTIITESVGDVGTYKNASDSIKKYAKPMMNFIREKKFPADLSVSDQFSALQLLSTMMITEVERSKTALFTSVMFLDKVDKQEKIAMTDYPMAIDKAVNIVRKIHEIHKDDLPNSRVLDYKVGNTGKLAATQDMLLSEGKLLAEWSLINKASKLSNLLEDIKTLSKLQKLQDNISIDEYSKQTTALANFSQRYPELFIEAERLNITTALNEIEASPPPKKNLRDEVFKSRYKNNAQTLKKLNAVEIMSNFEKQYYFGAIKEALAESLEMVNNKILRECYDIDTKRLFHDDSVDTSRMHTSENAEYSGSTIRAEDTSSSLPGVNVSQITESTTTTRMDSHWKQTHPLNPVLSDRYSESDDHSSEKELSRNDNYKKKAKFISKRSKRGSTTIQGGENSATQEIINSLAHSNCIVGSNVTSSSDASQNVTRLPSSTQQGHATTDRR